MSGYKREPEVIRWPDERPLSPVHARPPDRKLAAQRSDVPSLSAGHLPGRTPLPLMCRPGAAEAARASWSWRAFTATRAERERDHPQIWSSCRNRRSPDCSAVESGNEVRAFRCSRVQFSSSARSCRSSDEGGIAWRGGRIERSRRVREVRHRTQATRLVSSTSDDQFFRSMEGEAAGWSSKKINERVTNEPQARPPRFATAAARRSILPTRTVLLSRSEHHCKTGNNQLWATTGSRTCERHLTESDGGKGRGAENSVASLVRRLQVEHCINHKGSVRAPSL